jgi:outer membrane receptor protein involved in Fe transport
MIWFALLCKKKAMKSILTFTLLTITALNGLAGNGKITGHIIDKTNSEDLIGAGVVIEGTKIGATTDIEGRFSISNINPGNYTIVISYVSYETQKISNVQVEDGKSTTIDIVLSSSENVMDEVDIVANVNKSSNTSLLLFQQKNVSITSGISQDAIKNSPDRNTGEVLKRVSGATVQDNKFVIIRGLSDRYNSALINGMPLPSTEPDRKAFSFDIFPSNMLDNMVIFKTASPDLPGDFAGGIILLNTRDIPESPFISLSGSLGMNSQSTFKPYKTYKGGKKDLFGYDDGTRQLPSDLPETLELKELLSNSATRYEYSKVLNNDWGIDSVSSSPVNQNYQLAMGTNLKLFKRELGVIGGLTYSYSRRKTIIQRGDYNVDTTQIFEYNDTNYEENIMWGAILNFAYKLNDNNKIWIKSSNTFTSEDLVTERFGIHIENDRYEYATSMQYNSSRLLTAQLGGEHFLNKSKIKINWAGAYNNIFKDTPDLRKMLYYKNRTPFGNTTDSVWTAYVPFGAGSKDYAGKFYSQLNESSYSAKADASIPFQMYKQKHNLKIGAFYTERKREFNSRTFGYAVSNPSQFNYDLLYLPQNQIFNMEENIGVGGFKLSELTSNADLYTAASKTTAAFVMFDQTITKKLRAVWGMRFESFRQMLNSKTYSGDTVAIDTTYFDYLPSMNLTYSLSEKTNIRLSASRTVARPEFREIAPFAFYDFNTSTAVTGNDTLIRTKITNIDTKFEIYPGMNQLFSIGGFYKHFKNPIESVTYFGGAGSRTRTYQNAPSAQNYGVELEYRWVLSCLDSMLKTTQFSNITWFSNLALIKSQVDLTGLVGVDPRQASRPLQGQSPFIINTGLQYTNKKTGTTFSTLFNRIGRRIFDVGSDGYLDIYEAPRSLWDCQISQRIFKNWELRFTASDILNQKNIFYQDQNSSGQYEEEIDTRITNITFGRSFSFSIAYRFQK